MAKARQQYFADETSLQKDSREFAIADDVQQKIDSIEEGAQVNVIETVKVNGTALTPDANKAVDIDVPDVIDNLYTTSSDDALSANQGKLLYDYIQNLSSRGRFLSNWNAATGLPATNPSENPYTYMAGDYYMVSNVASGGGTNYRPNGSSYTIGQASTTVETNIVDVSDIYLYDGTNWLLLTNSSRQIAVDSSLSTASTNPVENRVITNELNKKYYGVVSNATPSNPTEGMLWYDTTNDQLKVYDGTNWNATGKEYNAGPGINIGTYNDYSAMRGPAPDGFHVPTEGEWSIMANSLISTFGRDPVQDLKMPLTGYRRNTNGTVNNQGNQGDYRSVTYEDEVGSMYYLEIGNNSADVYTGTPTYGRAIRPFKDEYVSPDNTWTIIQGALGNTGIFRNQSEGLISITDGSVGYTIADKNLGATQVYNYGDTLSEANCGKYYQRGNNYGFPRTGSVTTSNTLVDASNYGPGNYYSSSTFITNNVGWDSSNNANLRGGETGVVTLDNTITNTGVLSVNGQTGDVAIQEGIEYNAGEGIEIGTVQDYSAIQGPCPNGFHMPTNTEFSNIFDIMDSLGIGADTVRGFIDYLLMPRTDFRDTDGSKINRNTNIYCWTCNTNNSKAIALEAYDDNVSCAEMNRGCGFSIRPFKNEPVIPDNGWTVLYSGTGDAGVFHNSTDGLISLSSDGTNWITIADKNLGATTVYHYGDTMSESNCGKFYQRGNNYGFPRTGTVTTSSTQVDASNYGPGNYYNSDTFITTSTSPYDWSSVQNDNLWGGVTGVVTINDAITNTGVLSVNGQTGDVIIPTPEESNTKTFYLSSTSDLTNAQSAYDWYVAGKNPIVVYDGANYTYYQATSSSIYFAGNKYSYSTTSSGTQTQYYYVRFTLSSGTVTGIYTGTYSMGGKYLTTDNTTSYTPTANYNPATKKYVDDHAFSPTNAGNTYDVLMKSNNGYHWSALDFVMLYKGTPDSWAVGDDWSDVYTAMDGERIVVLTTGFESYMANKLDTVNKKITVLVGAETYEVTLDSDDEISAITKTSPYMKRFNYDLSDDTTDITELMNYLQGGGNVCIKDDADWTMVFYVKYRWVNGSSSSLELFSIGAGGGQYFWFKPTLSNNVWTLGLPNEEKSFRFFSPSNSGSTGQILTKTAAGYNWADSGENTKTFYVTTTGSSATAIEQGQAIYDWYAAGKNPIIIYGNRAYMLRTTSSSNICFYSNSYSANASSYSYSTEYIFYVYFSGGTVSSTSYTTTTVSPNVLSTSYNYSTPYTPQYNGSPATKKYVDDKVAEAISNDTTGTTTTVTKIWAGTETEFANLQTKDSSTIYYTF